MSRRSKELGLRRAELAERSGRQRAAFAANRLWSSPLFTLGGALALGGRLLVSGPWVLPLGTALLGALPPKALGWVGRGLHAWLALARARKGLIR